MSRHEAKLTSNRCPFRGDVDDLAKLALFKTGKEVFAGEKRALYALD